ncbi:MAG: diacylglycerol/lipid kinase family protein [Candidatus Binatia bacterium]
MNQLSSSPRTTFSRMEPAQRVAVVTNPRACAKVPRQWWRNATAALHSAAVVCAEVETRGGGGNVDRITRLIEETRPQTVTAAGGDGTVSEVVQGIMQARVTPLPALAIIPLGTANDVARSLGLHSWRRGGQAAIDIAVTTVLNGFERRIDLGQVDGRYFVGSFAVGMDADILCWRNRYHDKIRPQALRGYPLYLLSCAVNLLRPHGGAARLCVDGATHTAAVYNLLITNTPIYAGEFRFDAREHVDDGRLDLQLFTGPLGYLAGFPAAWLRHLRYNRGRSVQPPRQLQRVRTVDVELDAAVVAQLDGEEFGRASGYRIRVVPQALTVRVPRVASTSNRDMV